jgi:hypothetical protein
MKKITFLVASVLMITGFINATEVRITSTENSMGFNFEEPISFNERGIEFFVFTNGEFDFNTRPEDSQGDYFYKAAGKRGSSNQARGGFNYGTRIEHDSFGRVRRVGNTFINYDGFDRVSRIGSVYMRYNRFALTQIGGMRIIYNHRGEIVNTVGNVKWNTNTGYAYNYNYCNVNTNYYTASNYNNNDYYYYKADGTRAKIEEKK